LRKKKKTNKTKQKKKQKKKKKKVDEEKRARLRLQGNLGKNVRAIRRLKERINSGVENAESSARST